jgi:thiol-disulfide isomerase/thioredoxin
MKLLPLSSLVAGLLAATAVPPVSLAQATAPGLPSAAGIRTAHAADSVVRDLFLKAEYYDGVALGDSLLRRFPADTRLRAWYVANLAFSGETARADSLTAKIDTSSRDPWLLAARAFARHNAPSPSRASTAEAIRLARRARVLAPREPDFAWIVATAMFYTFGFPSRGGAPVVAYLDSLGPAASQPAHIQALRADALYSAQPFNPMGSAAPDTASQNAALRAYEVARATDSNSYAAHYSAASRLMRRDLPAAIALAKRAVAIAPRSRNAHQMYWSVLGEQRIPPAEKNAAIDADRKHFLAITDSAAWAMDAVLSSMKYTTKEPTADLEARILARAPKSRWAETVLLNRVNQWRDSLYAARDSARPGPKSDSNVVRQRYIAGLEQFIDKPWVASTSNRDQAVTSLFFEVRSDTTYPAAKLIPLVHRLVESTSASAPSFRYGEGSRALSNRKLELPFAERLAREGMKHTASYLNDFPGYVFTSVGDQADALDAQNATLSANLGWVHYSAGRLKDAEKELQHALDLTKKHVNIYYDLGRVQAAQGRDDDAELTYAQGMTIRTRGVNPNRAELARIYEKKHGSIDGWEKYVGALEEKERATRKGKILAARDSQPKMAPGFALADLAGRTVRSDSLRSQTIVVNFWGMWCGPCVAEMPELQQFYDKYKNDKSVTILTISNDKDLAELRDWMAKRKLTIPTLFDDGYVAKQAQISVFPTTWFIDNTGKVQFKAIGNTGSLVEEWTWRLEATKAGPVIQP